jgi:Leucine-rich repeat (LRR) protein
MDPKLIAAQKRVKLDLGGPGELSKPAKHQKVNQFSCFSTKKKKIVTFFSSLKAAVIPLLKTLCLDVLLPGIIAKRDRYALMNLGPDIAWSVFEMMKAEHTLNGETISLFMHSHLSRMDLGGYRNTTQQFLNTVANLNNTLSSLGLQDCSKLVDFSPLGCCKYLQSLDLSGTKLNNKNLVHLKQLQQLQTLRLAETKITVVPEWLPVESLTELDLQSTNLEDAAIMTALRRLIHLQRLNLAGTGVKITRFTPLKELQELNLAGCTLLEPSSMYWLGGCKRLRLLDLSRTTLPGKTLFHLQYLTRLEHLALPSSGSVAAADLMYLSPLYRLAELSVPRYNITDLTFVQKMTRLTHLDLSANVHLRNLSPLTSLKSLEQLVVQSCTGLLNVSFGALAHLPNLSHLNLSRCVVNDEVMKPLSECVSLRSLALLGTDVGDYALRKINALTQLTFLDVRNTRVLWSDITVLESLDLMVVRHDPKPKPPPGAGGDDGDADGDGEDDF